MSLETARMAHFHALTPEAQCDAIRRLSHDGFSLRAIAAATGLSVEAVTAILSPAPGYWLTLSDLETSL